MTARFSGGGREPEETGIDAPTNGNNQNGNGNGNGNSNGGSNGGGVSEGTLHKWFKGSKSKDGKRKGGWVNVVTGGTCASDEPGEGTPKCVSSAKRASMSKSERLSAARRKKKADPGQQQKSGAAKPTYVATDKKKMKKEEVEIIEGKDKKGKGSGTKDACYHKVKSRYSVWLFCLCFWCISQVSVVRLVLPTGAIALRKSHMNYQTGEMTSRQLNMNSLT